jgi:oxygen-independent coproporphyrinogen III oxidase
MHREHTPEQVGRAVELLRSGGIVDLSLDLIFAVPDHLERDWARDLEGVVALAPNHVSVYGLTVEPHTPLGRWTARGEVAEAPEERYEQEFLLAHERLTGAGYEHYEVSNYGLPGHRAVHNSAYWRGVPYLGLGPSAHGFDGQERRWNVSAYAEWLRLVQGGADPRLGFERLGAAEREAEGVYLGLRTTDGLVLRQDEWTTVTPWLAAGWGVRTGDRLVLTPRGWLRLDALAASLTSLRSRS